MSRVHHKLIESVFSKPEVDRESGVIRNVKILGRESSNGYTYSDKALSEAAALYDGVPVNIDHPDRKRATSDRGLLEQWGTIRSPRVEADGVYGDLPYFKSHSATDLLLERAEAAAKGSGDGFGLSQNAEGDRRRRGKKVIVESVTRVHSVDIVGKPATTRGLFESKGESMKLSELLRQHREESPTAVRLLEMVDDMADVGEIAVDTPVEAPVADQVHAAMQSVILAILDDESLDTSAKLAKIRDVLKAEEKLSGDDSNASSDDSDSEDASSGESASDDEGASDDDDKNSMESKLDLLLHRDNVRTLCESNGIAFGDLTIERRSLLENTRDETKLVSLITSFAPKAKPSMRSLRESQDGGKTYEQLAAELRG